MTTAPTETPVSPPTARPERLTILAGWLLLVICLLHTIVFAVHPYWADWLAGPLREGVVTADETAQFWGLAGGFVVPGALLGLLVIRIGREGRTFPPAAGPILGLWASACLWIIGPSGFLFVLVPAAPPHHEPAPHAEVAPASCRALRLTPRARRPPRAGG